MTKLTGFGNSGFTLDSTSSTTTEVEQNVTTNELIATRENEQGEIIVSGRELHEFLEVGTRYDTWFERMVAYGFLEGVDFLEIIEKVDAQKRARTYEQVNHALKIDMAKEVSMLQRNEKGKQARRYFIEVEKRYKAQEHALPTTYKDALLALVEQVEQNEKLEIENKVLVQQNNELQPKASYYDLVLQNKSLLAVTHIAKDYGMSATKLNQTLKELGVQYKQGGVWLLYAKHQNKGYTQTTTHVIDAEKSSVLTKWTQKGRLFLYDLLKSKGILPTIERDNS